MRGLRYVSWADTTGYAVAAKAYLPDKPKLQGDALRNHLAKSQVVALIAYIQKLGAYREVEKDGRPTPTPLDPDSYRNAAERAEDQMPGVQHG